MRLTTIALSLSLTACVGAVGGDDSTRNHMPSGNCEKVETDVTIRTPDDFRDLPSGCWDLYGTLTVQGSQITSLKDLGELSATDGFVLDGTSVAAIDVAKPFTAYGHIIITDNTKLANLKNLEVDTPDGIDIENNAVLATLDKLAEATELGGGLTLNANPQLGSVTFKTLHHVGGDVVVTSSSKLATLTFPNLQQVGGSAASSIKIANNGALTMVDFSKVETVASVEVSNNVALASIGGLYANQVDNLTIRGNTALTSLGSFSALERILGNLMIDDNDALSNLGMFTGSMKYVTGFVSVTNNEHLTDLGMTSHFLGMGAITITSNPALSNCKAQEVNVCVPQHGNANIQFNQTANNCSYWCQ